MALDPTNIVLYLSFSPGINDVHTLSKNSRCNIPSYDGIRYDPADDKVNVLALKFGWNLFSPEAWIFSSTDINTRDLQVAKKNSTGISRQYVQIDTNPLTCLQCMKSSLPMVYDLVREREYNGESANICRMTSLISGPSASEYGIWNSPAQKYVISGML